MTDIRFEKQGDEKEEKPAQAEEKAEEKTSEKTAEKSVEEKWRRDPLGSVAWAIILIWAGLVLLASNLGLTDFLGPLAQLEAWSIVLAGAGVIILIEVIIRLLVPAYRRPIIGSVIFALILIGVGLGPRFGFPIVAAVILIVIGLAMIVGGLVRRRP